MPVPHGRRSQYAASVGRGLVRNEKGESSSWEDNLRVRRAFS